MVTGYKKVIKYSRKGVKYVHHEKYLYIPSPPRPMTGSAEVLIQFEGSAEVVDELLRAIDVVLLNNALQATVNARVQIKEQHGLAPAPVDPVQPGADVGSEGGVEGKPVPAEVAADEGADSEDGDGDPDAGSEQGTGVDDGNDDVA